MKKQLNESNQANKNAFANYAKLQLTKDQQMKVKGGDGDGVDVIIIEDPVINKGG